MTDLDMDAWDAARRQSASRGAFLEAHAAGVRIKLRELRKRINAQAINYAAFPDEFGKGVDYAFTLAIIEIDRMLDEEKDRWTTG